MKVLVVGGGGREHAIIKKLKENKEITQMYCAPGNGGIAADAVCVPYKSTQVEEITAWAAENGIVTGYPDNTFKGGNNMTRQDLVTMIYRFAEYKGIDVSVTADLDATFSDASDIKRYAKTPVAWAVANDIVNGMKSGNTYVFKPEATATRAQVAVIIQRLMQGE